MTNQPQNGESAELARIILLPFLDLLNHTAPEQTIHELREQFLARDEDFTLKDFTEGLRFLLETRYLIRLNDERLELSPAGREFLCNKKD